MANGNFEGFEDYHFLPNGLPIVEITRSCHPGFCCCCEQGCSNAVGLEDSRGTVALNRTPSWSLADGLVETEGLLWWVPRCSEKFSGYGGGMSTMEHSQIVTLRVAEEAFHRR